MLMITNYEAIKLIGVFVVFDNKYFDLFLEVARGGVQVGSVGSCGFGIYDVVH